MTMHAKKIGDYLDFGDGIGRLMPQVTQLLTVRQGLMSALPDNLRRSCQIANVKQGKVVIFAENTAVAAKVRLLVPGLLAGLNVQGTYVTGITVEVQPVAPGRGTAKAKSAVLSPAAGKALDRLAVELPDGRLGSAIRSLARRVR
jgi:hypothetical protein